MRCRSLGLEEERRLLERRFLENLRRFIECSQDRGECQAESLAGDTSRG